MRTNLDNYLDFYCSLLKPGYAVLITGAWGVGKTYQVRRYFVGKEFHYVSLFGVESVEQLNSEVVALCNPRLSKVLSGAEKLSDEVSKVGGFFALSGLSSTLINAAFKQSFESDKVLVFDDLERCSIKDDDLLGAINQFVEHHGFNVLVIAHDGEVSENIKQKKEKVFGQILRVSAGFDSAFSDFLSIVSKYDIRAAIQEKKAVISTIFEASGVESLRILRHVIEDLARLLLCLKDRHLDSVEILSDLVGLHVSLNIEVRASRLDLRSLSNRAEIISDYEDERRNDDTADKPNLVLADERYSDIKLNNQIISDAVLCEMLFNGEYVARNIQNDIDASIYSPRSVDLKPWKVIANLDAVDDEVLEKARIDLNESLENRSMVVSGDMLHSFAIKFMMVSNNIEEGSVESVEKQCLTYIDELYEGNRLQARETARDWADEFSRSHEGISYWVEKSYADSFNRIVAYLVEMREVVLFDSYEDIWADLKCLMISDANAFLYEIGIVGGNKEKYQNIAIFKDVNVSEFVDNWLQVPVKDWRKISMGMSFRYAFGSLDKGLAKEKLWAQTLYSELLARVDNSTGISKLRLQRAIPNELANYFKNNTV